MSGGLINLGDLTKPATVLIQKISDAIGGIAKPWQIIRVAEAEAAAEQIMAIAQAEIPQLQQRALRRFLSEETRSQTNIESITAKALPQLAPGADPSAMENDWIRNFFDKSRLISDEEMQSLWATVLAGEANKPGKYSKKTVYTLSFLDNGDAQLLTVLRRFCFELEGDIFPMIFDHNHEIYTENSLKFNTLAQLEDLGLIRFEHLTGFHRTELKKHEPLKYGTDIFILHFESDAKSILDVGKVLLTKAGEQLIPLCQFHPVHGLVEYVFEHWTERQIGISCPCPKF
jgi:hypothetical protein